MGWIPGWESIQATGWWSGFFFWASIVSLIGLGISEVASHRYAERKDELVEVQQTADKKAHDDEIALLHLETAKANRDAESARAEIAEANARAAEANQKAKEAALELEKFRTPRVRQLETGSNIEILTKALSPFAGTKFDVGHEKVGREQWDFLWVLEPVLIKAGWTHENWVGGEIFMKNGWPGGHIYGVANVSNVSIEVFPDCPPALTAAALALTEALKSIGVDAAIGGFNNSSQNPDTVHILVGNKE